MTELVGYILILIAVFNAGLIVVPYLLGKAELLTIRNFFLLGFIVYQVTSGAISLLDNYSYDSTIMPSDPDGIAAEYLVWLVSFEIVFLLFYRWGIGAKRAAKWTPVIRGQSRETLLWIFAFTLLGLAALFRLSVNLPYIAVITSHLGTSTAAVAAGLGAWIWVRRPLNPAAAAMMFLILITAVGIGISGEFGRRPIVAVGGCLIWGTYYSRWREFAPMSVIAKAAVFGIVPIILVANYTAVRGKFLDGDMNSVQRIKLIATANTAKGLTDLMSGQECAAWSMWLMENHPESLPYSHLHAFKYYFQLPIPRTIYPDKPDALAQTAWRDAGISGKPSQYTIGPGVIGHAGAEGGYLVLLFYAAVLGLFIRYFDAILARAPGQPFVALPIGASLGNMLGLARGEVPNFAFEFTIGVVGSLIMLLIVAYILKIAGFISEADFTEAEIDHDYTDQDEHQQHYEQYADYGQEQSQQT